MPQFTAGQSATGVAAAAGISNADFLAFNPDLAARGGNRDFGGLTGDVGIGQSYNLGPAAPVPPTVDTPASNIPTQTNPNNPIISGASVSNSNDALGLDLQSLRDRSRDTETLIEDRMSDLERRRIEEIAGIRASFDEASRQQGDRQEKDFAGRSTGLITSGGGFLGVTQSQQGVLQNLNDKFEIERTALVAQKNSAIRAAENAHSDKEFSLARELIAEAKGVEQEIFDRQRQHASDQLAISREERAQEEFDKGITEDKIKAFTILSDEDFANVPQEDIAALDKFFYTGYTKALREIQKSEAEGESFETSVNLQSKIQSLINKTPAGQKITLPDGTVVMGMKRAVGSSKSTSGLITAETASNLGIPSLSGKKESDIVLSLNFNEPPTWFKQYYAKKFPEFAGNPTDEKAEWDSFKSEPDIEAYKNSAIVSSRIASAQNSSAFNFDLDFIADTIQSAMNE